MGITNTEIIQRDGVGRTEGTARRDYPHTHAHTVQTQNVYGTARMQLVASNEILLNSLGILAFVNASAAGAPAGRVCACYTHVISCAPSLYSMPT
jgi:hypothetical protein